jgi:hypothetical protein
LRPEERKAELGGFKGRSGDNFPTGRDGDKVCG